MYDEDLENLEEGLRRLKVEYHIFLSGSRKKPPDDLRIRVERIVKKLSESSDMSFSQRFRFSTLVTRYYVYKDLWRREVQNREMDLAGRRRTYAQGRRPHSILPSPGRSNPHLHIGSKGRGGKGAAAL